MARVASPKQVVHAINHRRTRSVEDSRMSLTDHLRELRNRLAKALLAFALVTAVCFFFEPRIFDIVKAPYCNLPVRLRYSDAAGNCQLVFFGVVDAFFIRLKISMIAGALFSSPIWLYQLWSFVTPGLHRHERRWALTFVTAAVSLFALGAFFAYLTLSKGLHLLLGFGGNGLVSILEVNKYLSYVYAMLAVFGFSFEFPLLVTMLNLAGVVSTAKLRSWRRPEIFLVFVFAAVITPSQDPFTMCALAVPMCIFYEVTILIGRFNDRRKIRRGAAAPYAELDDDEVSPLDLDDLSDDLDVPVHDGVRVGASALDEPGAGSAYSDTT